MYKNFFGMHPKDNHKKNQKCNLRLNTIFGQYRVLDEMHEENKIKSMKKDLYQKNYNRIP